MVIKCLMEVPNLGHSLSMWACPLNSSTNKDAKMQKLLGINGQFTRINNSLLLSMSLTWKWSRTGHLAVVRWCCSGFAYAQIKGYCFCQKQQQWDDTWLLNKMQSQSKLSTCILKRRDIIKQHLGLEPFVRRNDRAWKKETLYQKQQ